MTNRSKVFKVSEDWTRLGDSIIERCLTWDITPPHMKLSQGMVQGLASLHNVSIGEFFTTHTCTSFSCNIRKRSVPNKRIFQVPKAYLRATF